MTIPSAGKPTAAVDDYRWLIGPEAAARLADLETDRNSAEASLTRLAKRLRSELSQPRAHMLLEQLDLRIRARGKFAHAGKMFFTRQGLEQSSDQWVAEYKASRFPAGGPLADLCCGIGGDLQALAARGRVLGIDRDPIAGLLAEANLRNLAAASARASSSKVVIADVDSIEVDAAAWHIDPDRRPQGGRTTRVELHEPGPDVLLRLIGRNPNAAIKLAPAATFEEPWWRDAELEWISRGRQCRQLVAWFGNLAEHPGRRRATVLRSKHAISTQPISSVTAESDPALWMTSFVGQADLDIPVASRIGRYVFEPDPAILAAKLEGALAANQNLEAITAGIAYFTADHRATHGALSCFEVLEVMPYKVKPLQKWLAANGIGRLEIKKRGVELAPEQVRRDLQTRGSQEAAVTILLARISGRLAALITRRV